MTSELEWATKMRDVSPECLLEEVLTHAEQARIKMPKGDTFNRVFYCKPFRGNLAITIRPLKDDLYICYIYDHPNLRGEQLAPHQILPHAEVYLLKHDRHHCKWIVDSWSSNIGEKRLRQRLHELNADYALKKATVAMTTP